MSFTERAYAATVRIPKGRVATYGQIAEMAGLGPGAARAVGNALHANPYGPDRIPCHRVVAANGSLAENYAFGGTDAQYGMLKDEGVAFLASSRPRVDLDRSGIRIERHPLEPFLPENGRTLFLGSFPPPHARWSMEFFYPNWINDFWRIQGVLGFGDRHHFEAANGEKRFDRDRIIGYCLERGFGLYDTARKVCRLKGNASDEFLEILEPADIEGMLSAMPLCHTIVTTGGKASTELASILQNSGYAAAVPGVGESIRLDAFGRALKWWRMPSSSRAFPMSLEEKAVIYGRP